MGTTAKPSWPKVSYHNQQETMDDGSFATCPLCNGKFPVDLVEIHASECEGEDPHASSSPLVHPLVTPLHHLDDRFKEITTEPSVFAKPMHYYHYNCKPDRDL